MKNNARILSLILAIALLLGLSVGCASADGEGGTWSGSEENLRKGWSPLFVHDDGSEGCSALIDLGATPVKPESLTSLSSLQPAMLPLTTDG